MAAEVGVLRAMLGTRPRDAREQACDLPERFGLVALTEIHPEALSDGELQRASIAGALIMSPSIFFSDELTGSGSVSWGEPPGSSESVC